MLLESAMADQQQMLLHGTTPDAQLNVNDSTNRMVLKRRSLSESSCELLKNSGEPMTTRHAGLKEERQIASSRSTRHIHQYMIHLSEEEDNSNCYGKPGRVPFKWELQPGVPKPPKIEGESTELHEGRSSPAPLRLPPSVAAILTSSKATTESASPKRNGRHFSCTNLSRLYRQSNNVRQESLEGGGISDYDGDEEEIIPSNFELVSNEQLSPVSNKDRSTAPSSPARRALTTLILGVFPCGSIKQKEKSKQTVWVTGYQGKESGSEISYGSTSHQEPARPNAVKKKSLRML